MMKKILAVLMAFVMIMSFASCGNNNALYEKDVDAGHLADFILGSVSFDDMLAEVDDDIITQFYGISEEIADDGKVYMSSGATAEEIAVFEVENDTEAAAVKKAFEQRIADQKAGFENYVTAELTKLENPVIEQVYDAVVLVICNDTEEAAAAIQTFADNYVFD